MDLYISSDFKNQVSNLSFANISSPRSSIRLSAVSSSSFSLTNLIFENGSFRGYSEGDAYITNNSSDTYAFINSTFLSCRTTNSYDDMIPFFSSVFI
jgi:hypothetical protein